MNFLVGKYVWGQTWGGSLCPLFQFTVFDVVEDGGVSVHSLLLEIADKPVAEARADHVSYDKRIHEKALPRCERDYLRTQENSRWWMFHAKRTC